jgi:hypothetical protein
VCEREIWPPSSPDFNRLDCIKLGVYGLWVNLKPHNKTQNLFTKIKEVMESFERNTMVKASKRFRSGSKAVVTADGSFTE